jgi:ubiquinone/menaquinone biosynthesis C-methylase UbiE|tara:strand:+ start:398 stop:1201 length:804 start_codon:yes stop_codon:yes gene_type:complete
LVKSKKQYFFTLKGSFKRLKEEYYYYNSRPWSLKQVGQFWDTVEDYDLVNSELYPYYRRFTNSYSLAKKYLHNSSYNVLDIQARSAKGTEFWSKKINISSVVCVDFSDFLISLADKRLKKLETPYQLLKIDEMSLPIEDNKFNLILCYETIEHVYEYDKLIGELKRLISKDGLIILTCPAVSWEWVHWLSAVININHSEGPHRFLKRKKLIQSFQKHGLKIIEENSTILLPFNNKTSILIDGFLEKYLPVFIKRSLMLRRSFVLKKV